MKKENFTPHYFNVQQRLYSNQELSISDKFVLAYIVSIYESTNNFYMSDKKLAENLGTTVRTIRYSIDKLKKYDWFFIDTNANISKDKKYIGKTRNIIIDIDKLNKFLTTKAIEIINEEPKELPQDESSVESDIQLPEEKESPLDRLEIEEAIITGFTNNYGQTMVIDEKYINFFNEIIINKKKKIEDLKTYKHNDLFNYRIEELYNDYQDSIEIINTPISFLRK
jgi:hypothetical protein